MPRLTNREGAAARYAADKINAYGGDNVEGFADGGLAGFVGIVMKRSLREAHIKHQRAGWWTEECTVERLKELRDKAIADDDNVSVVNYSAMIMFKEAVEYK